MTRKIIKPAALSILLHGVFIFALLNFTFDHQKPEIEKPLIKSYVFFENLAAVSEPLNKTKGSLDEVINQGAHQSEMSILVNTPEVPELETAPAAEQDLVAKKATPADLTASMPSPKIKTGVAQYIQNLHAKELGKIAKNALTEFRKPKPLIDKSIPLSTNQRLKALSSTFAPKGADIIVLSAFGPNETTIIQGDACFTITQTALDDKVWRGASVWKKTDACGKYDKYDGQLQRSLNKYLQK